MGIEPEHLAQYAIRPALRLLGASSLAAEQLLLGTAAAESQMGRWLHQVRGPALGVFQMEPRTYLDHVEWLDVRRPGLPIVLGIGVEPDPNRLCWDLRLAAVMARVHYLRVPAPLPDAGEWAEMARYWKAHYNTAAGKGTPEHFLRAAHRHGLMSQVA